MTTDVNNGPLTDDEREEMSKNMYSPETLSEMEKEQRWLTNVLNNTPEGDIARPRFSAMAKAAERYVELKKRDVESGEQHE